MKNFDEILETLNTQKKQTEAQFLKIEGAIEIVTSMKNESEATAKVKEKSKKK